MKYVDVIGIGAINYDYMFSCKKEDNSNVNPDTGRENLGRKEKDVKEETIELHKTCKSYSTQIGGSSLLALKAIHAIDSSLSISFVGVCGKTSEFDRWYGKDLDIKKELSFIDNQKWLFYTDDDFPENKKYIGRASIKLNKKNTRGNINISSGANDSIIELIKKKERDEKVSLSDFLAQARWIHISSLGNFGHFESIMEAVIQAKNKNCFLRISIDPGNQYTDEEKNKLQKYLNVADYVFLNKDEFNNLILNEDLSDDAKYTKLLTYFKSSNNTSHTKVIVIKHKNRHELIDFVNGTPYIHYHITLPFYKIHNDTGAGDCFAGGFIAGMLSDRLIAQQSAPIELGVLAAKIRLMTGKNDDVYDNIKMEANKFFSKRYKNGSNSKRQNVIMYIKNGYKSFLSFISGVIISIVASIIYSIFCS